jgi:hypothetical protein
MPVHTAEEAKDVAREAKDVAVFPRGTIAIEGGALGWD